MHALTIHGLRKRYANGFEALKGLDLTVEAGDFFALLGANGAGKSTVIGIISSLVTKSAGQVSVFGHDLDQDPYGARRCIGLVPQEVNFNLFDRVEDILINQAGYYGLPRSRARMRAEICLKQLQLWDKRHATSRQLSGGMKRRLMIARALVHEPRMLILDEPTAGVDIEIRRSMWTFLQRINQEGTTIILTTHYLEEAENLCRNLAIIDKGQLVEHSPVSRLLGGLQYETYLLDVDAGSAAIPSLAHYTLAQVDQHQWSVEVSAEHGIQDLLKALADTGVRVNSLRPASNRLEQLLLHYAENRGLPA